MKTKTNRTRTPVANLLMLLLLFSTALLISSFQPAHLEKSGGEEIVPIYLDTSYSFEERAADLVSRLTLEEKQSQLVNTMPAIPRLGINAYQVWGEALHGIASFFHPMPATSFPNSVALGASWDPELAERETRAIADEGRGANQGIISGLTYWSPVVEPARDPRWGRNGEAFSEDPFLVSRIASGFVRGFMGDDPVYYKAVPTAKHFVANNSEFNRHDGNSEMDERDLHEYYLDPYRNLIVKDKLPSIMTAYNRVNGIPVSADIYLIDSIVRKNWGLDGYVTSDCGGISDMYAQHRYFHSPAEATAAGLIAGVDCNCGPVYGEHALEALEQNLMTEAHMDKALLHVFTIRMKTGEFDPPSSVSYTSITRDVMQSQEHLALALEVAEKTPVLLKNEDEILPLRVGQLRKIALIGPKADAVELGPYSGFPSAENKISPLAGIKNYLSGKGSDIELLFSTGASTSSSSNLCHLFSFTIKTSDGTSRTYQADTYAEGTPSLLLKSNNIDYDRSKSIRNINANNWVAFDNINLSDAASVSSTLKVPGDGGVIEIRTGSRTGNLLATLDFTGKHSGMMGNIHVSSEINQLGVSGAQKLYFIFKAPLSQPIDQATIDQAKSADVALVFVGTDDRTSAEEADRGSLLLPGNQVELIKEVAKVNPHTVVVMQTVGMVEIESFKDMATIPGIIWYGYNGQAQGTAIANILFGEVNPGGKLHSTWYRSEKDLAPITEYNLRGQKGNASRTYWYYDGPVSYEFGYGLSYTTFEYSNFKIDKKTITPNDEVLISVDVKNTGKVDGDEIVQVYLSTPDSPPDLERPVKRLKGFQRVNIPAGSSRTVDIGINVSDLWFWDAENQKIIFDEGEYVFEIGASSRAIEGKVSAILQGDFKPELRTVTAESNKLVLELGERVKTEVSAAYSDDSFLDLTKAQISYRSLRPDVATVDASGVVTALASGTALIEATVKVEGTTLSDSYPVKVKPDLSLKNLSLDGVVLADFTPKKRGYSLLINEEDGSIPEVSAYARDTRTQVSIKQARKIPGTALIQLKDSRTGESSRVAVYFGPTAISDEFENSSLGEFWTWQNFEKDSVWYEKDTNAWVIQAQQGGLEGKSNNAKNILLQSANTDWSMDTRLVFSRTPAYLGEQAGILAYGDDDNFVKAVCKFSSGGFFGMVQIPMLELIVEAEGSPISIASIPASELLGEANEVFLRLSKAGSIYTAHYSRDGLEFTELGNAEIVLEEVQVGLLAVKGTSSSDFFSRFQARKDVDPKLNVSFSYFRIESK
jgi:beta-glucosidase-like glycosyl hydrolase/regulation of enolase protein 1 (concanavalin A-like superfamily)